jgi:hypothetical protein
MKRGDFRNQAIADRVQDTLQDRSVFVARAVRFFGVRDVRLDVFRELDRRFP